MKSGAGDDANWLIWPAEADVYTPALWAGETWSYSLDNGSGHFVDGLARSESVEVCDGVAMVTVEDTGAAIVFFDP